MREIIISDVPLLAVVALYFLRGKKSVESTQIILAFSAAAIMLPCMLMFSPEFPARAAFASPVFALIATVTALERTTIDLPRKLVTGALCVWLVTIVYALSVDWSVHSQISERMDYIAAHKNDSLVVIKPLDLPKSAEVLYWEWTLDSYARFYGDLTPYRDKFNNRNITFAQYHGLKEAVMNKELWSKQTQYILY